MGLFQQAVIKSQPTQTLVEQNKKKKSLLGKVVSHCAYDNVEHVFHNILAAAHCEKGFLLYPSSERLQVVFQKSFDLTSCVRMIPEIELFGELCKTDSWNRFEADSISPFSPYFSTKEYGSLDALFIHSVTAASHTAWLVLAQSRLSIDRADVVTDTLSDLLDELGEVLSGNIPLTEALTMRINPEEHSKTDMEKIRDSFTQQQKAISLSVTFDGLFQDLAEMETDYTATTLYRALANKIIRQAGPASIVRKTEDYSLRILIFTASCTDAELYVSQMKKNLEKLFGATRIAHVVFTIEGSCTTPEQAREYLEGLR